MDSTALQLVPTPEEELAECEAIIARYKESFYDAGKALDRVKPGLYRMRDGGAYQHKTFEEYCWEIWHWKRRHIYELIEGAEAR